MDQNQLNIELRDAINSYDIDKVTHLLAIGADPNYSLPKSVYISCHDVPYSHQPYTALRLLVFRLSDCDLSPERLASFKDIAALLIDADADAKNALELITERHGKFKLKSDQEQKKLSADELATYLVEKIIWEASTTLGQGTN